MRDQPITVYFGENFHYAEQWSQARVQLHLENFEIEEAKMPTPTRRNPLKYKTVYRYTQSRREFDLRDDSAQMPPRVVHDAACGDGLARACADAWAGMQTPGFRDLPRQLLVTRILVNTMVPV